MLMLLQELQSGKLSSCVAGEENQSGMKQDLKGYVKDWSAWREALLLLMMEISKE
jgi:hypothetical protein